MMQPVVWLLAAVTLVLAPASLASDSHDPATLMPMDRDTLRRRQVAVGWSVEEIELILHPMVEDRKEPTGSMGDDAPLAVLSDNYRGLHHFFRQSFSQVTNPAIDSIREDIIMSLECYIGPEQNLLETTPEHANRLLIPHPILTNDEMAAIKSMDHKGWKSKIIDITYPRSEGTAGLTTALERICTEAEEAIDDGYSIVVLSDRAISAQQVPISSLLACGSLHHHLVKQAKRTRIGIVIESGEAREVHHHCLLVGYGADGINP